NDFDGADRYPYYVDLRRLTVGMVLMARLANPGNALANERSRAAARDVAEAVAASYAEAIETHAEGAPRLRVTQDGGVPGLVDLFRRADRDDRARSELGEQTVLVDGQRRLRRGVLDAEDPEEAFHELPGFAHAFVREALEE